MLRATSSRRAGAAPLLGRADRWNLIVLVVAPIACIAGYSIAGHPILPGDELLQNFPLRVLSGRVLASGRLPTWDPFIWSGTPLLGGWNAGAMYPGTWVFAVLPALAAWTVNFCAVPVIAASGMYVFARHCLRLRPTASMCTALVFTYTGYVIGQLVHLGLEQGAAVVPWILLGMDGLSRRTSRRVRLGHGLIVATGFALCVLGGDPRAVSNAGIVIVIYLGALVLRASRARLLIVAEVVAAVALGGIASALQWLPGLGFLGSSQRQSARYTFFGAGSVSFFHQLADFTVPYLSGGAGNLGLPLYTGNYNIPEVTMGVGFVGMLAAMVYLPEVLACALAFCRRTTSPRQRHLGVWFVLVVVGIVLSAGTTTPLGHVLFHLPLFGAERLQNRNIFLADLALAVLVGHLVDDLLADAAARGPASGPRRAAPWWARTAVTARVLGLVPSVAAGALIVAGLVAPRSLERRLDFTRIEPQFFHRLAGYLVATLVVAVLAGAIVVLQTRLTPRTLGRLALVLVALDVCTYVLNASVATVPARAVGGPTVLSRAITRALAGHGRYAFYNPGFSNPASGPAGLAAIGVGDLNILQGNPSVEGYGSILDNDYADATGTHQLESVTTSRLSQQTFDTLDLRVLVTFPGYLATVLTKGERPSVTRTGRWTIAPGATADFFLPGRFDISRATVVVTSSGATRLVVGATGTGGRTRTVAGSVVDGELRTVLRGARATTVVIVRNPSSAPVTVGAVVATTAGTRQRLLLSGPLEGAMSAPQWSFKERVGSYVMFVNHGTHGLGWLQPLSTHTPNTTDLAPGSVRIENTSVLDPQRFVVDATHGARLVRSETFEPGWTATFTSLRTGATVTRGVGRFGLVQSVTVSAGRYIVTWHYAPSQLTVGLAASAAGSAGIVFAFCSLVVVTVRRRRRNRTRPVRERIALEA